MTAEEHEEARTMKEDEEDMRVEERMGCWGEDGGESGWNEGFEGSVGKMDEEEG